MRLLRLSLVVVLVVAVGCQTPANPTPTPTPMPISTLAPTSAPGAGPTAAPTLAPTSAPRAAPTAAPSVAPTSVPTIAPPAASQSRIDVLNAGDAAFSAGQFQIASGLYQRVVDTPPAPAEGTSASTITELAHFRAMLSLLADGREDEARSHLEALRQTDPEAPLARLAAQLWDQYGMTGELRGACLQLQPQVLTQAGPTLATLQGLGVTVDPTTLCSVPHG